MITTEGLNYLLNTGVKQGSPVPTFYVAPYKANYTPVVGDTAAIFPSLAQESTAYSGTNRAPVIFGTVSDGQVDNASAVAELTFTQDETIYGAFVISTGAKGAAAGILLATQKFASPRAIAAGTKVQLVVNLDLTQPA